MSFRPLKFLKFLVHLGFFVVTLAIFLILQALGIFQPSTGEQTAAPREATTGAKPVAPTPQGAEHVPPFSTQWLGERKCCESGVSRYGGILTVNTSTGKPTADITVSGDDGCKGNVGGSLDIDGAHARLVPPLFIDVGKERVDTSNACDLDLQLGSDSSVRVVEASCLPYHRESCSFSGDYRVGRQMSSGLLDAEAPQGAQTSLAVSSDAASAFGGHWNPFSTTSINLTGALDVKLDGQSQVTFAERGTLPVVVQTNENGVMLLAVSPPTAWNQFGWERERNRAPEVIHWLLLVVDGNDLQVAVFANTDRRPMLPASHKGSEDLCKGDGDGCTGTFAYSR